MEEYVFHNGRKLRKGYTTGTCATAAAVAASYLLCRKKRQSAVNVLLPTEQEIMIPIDFLDETADGCVSAVKKDGGDDVDATDGMQIYAKVSPHASNEIIIDGGIGIGRVTQEGLLVPVGEAAINPVPRKMIETNVRGIIGLKQGVAITIYAPQGEEIARQTMNERLGIVGGISILGTTGIVTPMSEESWKQAISLELEMKKKQGFTEIVLCPGNYGEDFAHTQLGIPKNKIVSMSNFVGYVLKEIQRLGFEKVLMVGHLGKMIKVAAGIFSTHSKDADARMEILIANLALMGMPAEVLKEISTCITTESAGDIICAHGYQAVYQILVQQIQQRSQRLIHFRKPETQIDVVLFSSKRGFLAATQPLDELKEAWR